MYSLPSMSQIRLPSPRVMNTGSRPTARKALAGEFTPPGMDRWALANRELDWSFDMEVSAGDNRAAAGLARTLLP